ncbi:MAG TPA: prolyl oligopeptidase family serine peptidase [Stellaceae bacterium]|nr:prolyl oligopeptidase family serine peptidase [Stellaceae bacterium]
MQTLPYGAWRSPITSDLIVAGSIGLSAVQLDGDDTYWIESRPAEGGRNVLVRNGTDVTPAPYNTRTRVHEYGGGSVTVDRGVAYFTNFTDQRLYRAAPGAAPEPVTPEGGGLRHADGAIDRTRNRWIGIREEHAAGGRVDNLVVAVELDRVNAGRVLAQGCDFYAAPRLSPDGKRLAFVSWNHPNMPWVGTELWVADITEDGGLASARRVAGGDRESVAQPLWSPDGVLHFISDRSGWWNLYRFDGETARPICPRAAEFAGAQWVLGQASYAFLGADRLICTFDDGGRSVLARLEISSGRLTPLSLPFAAFGSIQARNGRIVCLAGSATGPGAVVSIDSETGAYDILRRSSDTSEWERYFSVAQHVEFPTANGETAHANFYPPANPDHAAPAGERPPLVVKCHGGPTSSASSTLSLGIQYWTSRGIAVADIDYRGSTGYGRAYRDRLEGAWGVVDVEDCIAAARHAAAAGLADPQRAVITGGSAGGYTVLAALAGSDVFKGGASYYGVSDVAALARDTHKFESRYLDWLIGPYPREAELYRQRSPLTHAANIRSPVIFFQGADDKVVPPNQTEMMVDALKKQGIPVGYLLFSGEAHGFRRGENVKRSLDAELYFYAELIFRTRLSF